MRTRAKTTKSWANGLDNEKIKRGGLLRPRNLILAAVVILAALAGAAVQLGLLQQFFANDAAHAAESPAIERRELPVGRIVTNLRGTGLSDVSHLILDPVIAYDVPVGTPAEADPLAPKMAELRDAFIDYLAGVSVDEISGSAGLATLRAELLRRARVVTADETPQAVLLQEFILQ